MDYLENLPFTHDYADDFEVNNTFEQKILSLNISTGPFIVEPKK